MNEDAGGCLLFLLLVCSLTLLAYAGGRYSGTRDGYRRGYCEGRGGVEATVGDSIRCIRPPLPVDTTAGAGVQGGGGGGSRADLRSRAALAHGSQGEADTASAKTPASLTLNAEG